ncbi:hypothetical protein QAD02_002448 [Eretmocerus hayati]|uniref:Uncharacterized protein n=1 Tax=Eretmocerus hayati TaxID=131215 RepID=A0ACC2NJ79_9HYME|nr:hypothetical protein QAD02_002448 [Eretmocerus hayati]
MSEIPRTPLSSTVGMNLPKEKLKWKNNRGLPVSPPLQLLIGLRYYATGDFQREVGDLHRFSQSPVCRVVHRVSVALAELLHDLVHFPRIRREQFFNIQDFYNRGGLPGVAGVIDGVQIEIIRPGRSIGEIFRNRKGYSSINVLVIVDNRGKILLIDATLDLFMIPLVWTEVALT